MTDALKLLRSSGNVQDPYPVYQRLRQAGQPVWLPQPNGHMTPQGTWLFFNHDDVSRLISDTKRTSHALADYRTAGSESFYDLNMLLRDGDDHQRLRGLVSELFSAQFLQGLTAMILELTHEQVNAVTRQGSLDLVEDLASVLPLKIMARLLGLPERDATRIRQWTLELHDMSDGLMGVASSSRRHVLRELHDYVAEHYVSHSHTGNPQTVIAKLRQDEHEGHLSRSEALAMVALLLVSGNATVTALLSTTLWLLLKHPAQLAQLQAQPDLLDAAIDESLRYESPVQRTIFRVTTDSIELERFRLEKGQQLSLVIGSAHRDESVFDEPDTFDIRRSGKSHLAFGRGVHTCLGRHLAQMEARLILGVVVDQLKNVELITQQPVWRNNSMFRELSALQVRLR